MRNPLAWLAGLAVAGAVGLKALKARRRRAPALPAPTGPAEELRRRLAESRTLVEERDAFEERELTVDRAEAAGDDPEARRRRVHEQGRAAVDEMRESAPE